MTKSHETYQKAQAVIPGGVNSPVRALKHVGAEPVYFTKGQGPYLYDVDGKQYIDFCLSFGPLLFGHADPDIVRAIQEQAPKGTTFGACHPDELVLANLILESYPFLQKVRLLNSGTEAVMTAIRLARGFTGRDKIVMFEGCYHGHSDGLLAKSGSGVAALSESASAGVPRSIVEDTIVLNYDDLDALENVFAKNGDKIAAIILEAIPANYGLKIPAREHHQKVHEIAKKYGSLLIFDEVITGFRVSRAGASGLYDLQPDLVTLGKIVGGGLPLAAVVGRSEILSKLAPLGSVYQAGTLSGNPLAVSAGIAALKKIQAQAPYGILEKRTEEFVSEWRRRWMDNKTSISIQNVASMFWIQFGKRSDAFPPEIDAGSKETYARFFLRALDKGLYFAPSPYEVGFLSTAHSPEVIRTVLERLEACKE